VSKLLRWLTIKTFDDNEWWRCNADEEARVLAGTATHVTGTESTFSLRDPENKTITRFLEVKSTASSDNYVLNPISVATVCVSAEATSNTKHVWFGSRSQLHFNGAATSYCRTLIEVVKIDQKTGAHLA